MPDRAPIDLPRLRAWTRRRQALGGGAVDALAALDAVVGVYSAHPTAPLALLARVDGFGAADFAGLEQRRQAVRIVGMRGSAFLVPVAAADAIVAATCRRTSHTAGTLRARGLDEAAYRRLRPRVLDAARTPISPTQLRQALGADEGDQQPYFTMRLMAREGLVVRVGTGRLRTDDLRWVASEAWLGRPLGTGDPDGALEWLADAYLRGYGPARVEDFAWWAGVPGRRARAAVEGLDTVEVGPGLLLPADLAEAWKAPPPLDADAIDVLPKWDAYTMGHAPDGRARLVDGAHLALAYSTEKMRIGATTGDGMPLILRGGRAVASWSHTLAGPRMTVVIRPFEGERAAGRRLIEQPQRAFDSLGRLLDASVDLALDG